MADPIDRRSFLRRGAHAVAGLAAIGVAGPLLEACGTSPKNSSSGSSGTSGGSGGSGGTAGAGTYGALSLVGPWVPDVETGGEYIAKDKGYWTKQGFSSVTIIPSGPNAAPQETTVETGKAFYGLSSLDATSAAIKKGFGLVVIGAEYQKSPFCIMSPATKPLKTPQDMIGKRIGVGSDNDAVWSELLEVNHISKSQVTTVPVGFDPTPLTQGTVDGWLAFITNEPIELRLKGFSTYTFLFQDYGLPEVATIYITTKNAVQNERAKLKAAMVGEILGWKDALTDPSYAAQLAVKEGQGLAYQAELLQAYAQNKLIATGDALTHGLFYVTPTAQANSLHTVALGGTSVSPSQVFDMSILDEIYAANPSLKSVPTPVES